MRRDRSLSGVAVGLFAVVGALVVLIFVVLLLSVSSLRSDTTSGRRTTDLLIASYGAEVALGEVSASLRGWLIDPAGGSAAEFMRAEATLAKQLGTLRLLASGASERGRVDALTAGVDRYLANYANPVAHGPTPLSESREAADVQHGSGLLIPLRHQFAELNNIELAERQKRRSALASQTSRTITIAAIGLAGSVLLLTVLGAYVLRGMLQPIRKVAAALERRGSGDLSTRVPERGRGEVAMLERSFNHMAEQLERATIELSDANRQLEQAVVAAEEASRMKSVFLANMSHEIRTPLNGVLGMVTLLAKTPLTDEQREYIEMARGASDTLLGVVSDILDVSKIEAGGLELEHADFDLHELVRATRDMLIQEAGRKGLSLRARIADDVPRAINGDRLRVGQVLGNLLSNAVKFTERGEVTLSASVGETTDTATTVRFEVRDTGIGIAADRLGHLFDPFTQADASTTRQFGGTGLGLTISRDLAKLMGGVIAARSEPGKGSTFEVSIPFAAATGEMTDTPAPVELRGLRILVVDDEEPARRALEDDVAAWGMRATIAPDAALAMTELLAAAGAGEPFDVALLDEEMPEEGGVALSRRIIASPRLRGTRLILMSGAGAPPTEHAPDGIHQRLTKPVSRSSLLDAIEAALQAELPALAHRAPERDHGGARILVAEDNAVNRMFVERLLSRRGYAVVTAVDGTEVLARLAESEFDLILMDCQMPELDGYDTTREIRRRAAASGQARIPIIAMTAASTDEIRGRCLEAGMDDYLSKPLGEEDLDRALNRGLARGGGRSAEDAATEDAATADAPTADAPAEEIPAPDDTSAGLDRSKLTQLRELFDDGEPGAVLIRLRAEINAALDRARVLVAAGDRSALAREAHSVLGSAEMIGADPLAKAAAELERTADHPPAPGAAASAGSAGEALDALLARWAETEELLRSEIESDRARASGV